MPAISFLSWRWNHAEKKWLSSDHVTNQVTPSMGNRLHSQLNHQKTNQLISFLIVLISVLHVETYNLYRICFINLLLINFNKWIYKEM